MSDKSKKVNTILDKIRNTIRVRSRLKKLPVVRDWVWERHINSIKSNYPAEFKNPEVSKRERELLAFTSLKAEQRTEGRNVLFINSSILRCGIHQYGVNVAEILIKSKKFNFMYAECDFFSEIQQQVLLLKPDIIIVNVVSLEEFAQMLSGLRKFRDVILIALHHEPAFIASAAKIMDIFDAHLIADPTMKKENPYSLISLPRFIPSYSANTKKNLSSEVVIGSFGLAGRHKGFEKLIRIVQEEFDKAVIRINMPAYDYGGRGKSTYAINYAKELSAIAKKEGIKLELSTEFLTHEGILEFLSANTLNAFLYDDLGYRGVSSVIDYALAVRRPICITKSAMFRHIYDTEPSICIEETTMKEVIKNGIKPLERFYEIWSEDAFLRRFEQILEEVLEKKAVRS